MIRNHATAIRRGFILSIILGVLGFLLVYVPDTEARTAAPANKPNIVVIMVDDAAASDLAAMPKTRSLLGAKNGEGAVYTNFHTATPLCCPSRATLLTGQYAHNHGVWDNHPPHGGWDSLRQIEPTLLPVAMNRAGYQTSFLGKYANGYNKPTVPKGWDKWAGLFGPRTYNYWHFDLSINGRAKRVDGYNTWNLGSRAVNQIRHRKSRDPLFMWLSLLAPHTTGGKDNRHVPVAPEYARTSSVGLPKSPAVNEKDVSDKPPWIQQRPRMDADARRWAVDLRQQRQEALRSVDDQVQRIIAALKARGELRDTVLMFISDNGYLLGQHRLVAHKRLPYTESTRVPLLIRGRAYGFHAGIHAVPVSNIDLAPTIAALGNADLIRRPDGIDLRRAGPDRTLLIEHLKPYDLVGMPAYCAVRQHGDLYVEYQGGVRELYTSEDRWQQWNRAPNPAYNDTQQHLADRMAALGHCGGTSVIPITAFAGVVTADVDGAVEGRAATGATIPAQRHCPTDETVIRCVWDARHMGDGHGRSYWSDGDDNGGAHYYSHKVAHRLAYGHWRRPHADELGRSVDLIHGGTRVITRGSRISVGDTTYVIWLHMRPHTAPIGTS